MSASNKLIRAVSRAALGLAALVPLAAVFAQSAPGPAVADSDKLETVVVTARRRAENLQEVPVAITAVTAEQLQISAVRTLEDLTGFAPNIKINAGRATNSTINAYIRGVGQNDPLWGFEPGVGIYIDDVYMARPQAALLDVYDVDRIEVLRGPQGTLYGKNTIAGAIKYVTRDIAGPATLAASATGGSFSQRDFKLSGSTPVTDHVYVGAAVAYLRRDGYGHVVDDGTPHVFNHVGDDVSDKDVLAARANATFVWGEDSKLKLLADTVQDNSNAAGGQRLNNFIKPALSSRFDTRTDMPVDKERFLVDGASATYTQSVSKALAFKLIGAYREGEGRQFIDFEDLNANIFQVPGAYRDHQGSGEAQLNWTGERVKAVGGLYYFTGNACGSFDASLGGIGLTSLTQGCVKTDSTAVYADTTWTATERVNVSVGARWNQDDKTANVFVAQYLGVLPANQTLFDRNALPAGFRLLAVQSDYANKRRFSNVSPRLGVDTHFTDHIMGYAGYSRGFKSGGFDMRGNAAANPTTKDGYGAETADNFELGVKSTLLDDTLQLNATVFYTPYKDVQITTQQFQIVAGNPTNVTAVLNAGKQLNEGAELESVWRPIKPLILTLNLGYLNSRFEDFLIGCTPPSAGCTVNATAFNRPINAPRWTSSLTGQYQWTLSRGALLAHIGYQYRSLTKVANTFASVTDQPAYGILDVGLAYTSPDRAWRLSVDGKNLADKAYRVAGYDFGNPGAGALGGVSQIGFYGPPRTISATVTYRY
jgi:iron complex outermembrane recepter protein